MISDSEYDMRKQALSEAIRFYGDTELMPEELIEGAEILLEFLKGEKDAVQPSME